MSIACLEIFCSKSSIFLVSSFFVWNDSFLPFEDSVAKLSTKKMVCRIDDCLVGEIRCHISFLEIDCVLVCFRMCCLGRLKSAVFVVALDFLFCRLFYCSALC